MSIESAGEKLKKIRQEKGLSLEEVQKKTKIHLNILKAIEGEGLTNLNPVYLKGFLKIYCNFLGLDPKDCVPDYKEAAPVVLSVTQPADEDKPLKPPSFWENASLRLNSLRPDKKRIRTVIIAVLIMVVSIVIIFKLGKFFASRPKTVKRITVQAQVSSAPVKLKINEETAVSRPQALESKLPKEPNAGINLVISAKENCLIFVKVDGRVVLHRVLERGRSDSWKAKDKIELSLANAAAVELIVNGQRFSNLGRKGQQLKRIIITSKDGLRIPK